MHPWEDWAETWAHYLHMVDTLETAKSHGLTVRAPAADKPGERVVTGRLAFFDFEALTTGWNAVTLALNSLNRSMGMKDAYPFVLSPTVLDKLRFVHELVQRAAQRSRRRSRQPERFLSVACPAGQPLPCALAHVGDSMRHSSCWLLCPLTAFAADDFKLNAQEYFERPGINVMYGQDYYPEGHQGGLSIIMHDERIASNGDVRLEPSPGQWSPIPKPGKREVNAATQEIRVPLRIRTPSAIARVSTPSSIRT